MDFSDHKVLLVTPVGHKDPFAGQVVIPDPVVPADHMDPVVPVAHVDQVVPAAHMDQVVPAAHMDPFVVQEVVRTALHILAGRDC